MRQRGFTLVEVLATCALVGIIAGIALPTYQSQIVRSRRVDAVAALTRLQAAEELYRANNGGYSGELAALRVAPRSTEGLYLLAVTIAGTDGYRATATALAGGPQEGDRECRELVLEVTRGFAQALPSARCWNR